MHCYVKNFCPIFLHLRLATAWAGFFFAQIFQSKVALSLSLSHPPICQIFPCRIAWEAFLGGSRHHRPKVRKLWGFSLLTKLLAALHWWVKSEWGWGGVAATPRGLSADPLADLADPCPSIRATASGTCTLHDNMHTTRPKMHPFANRQEQIYMDQVHFTYRASRSKMSSKRRNISDPKP